MTKRNIILDPNAMEPGRLPRWTYSPNRSKRILKKIKKRLREQYGSEYHMRPVGYILPEGEMVLHPSLAQTIKNVRDRPDFDIERAIRQTRGLT